MHIEQVRKIARHMAVKPLNGSKENLIRAIQRAEGNFPCYGTASTGFCDQVGCLWRRDCLHARGH